ncbi:RteC domain-containing protein [Empedobacter sp. ULE_I145]
MRKSLGTIITEIQEQERKLSVTCSGLIEEAFQMTVFLQELLVSAKECVLSSGFDNEAKEIEFFKMLKPQILGKLIYYNKLYRIETSCPVNNGKMYHTYFSNHLTELKIEFREHICNSHFYRYYRSGRMDKDSEYFKRGQINYLDGLNSYVFEIDPQFSTYYDYKVARIIANDLLYAYLLTKISPEENPDTFFQNTDDIKELSWTDSKNALIELMYALYASGAISGGKVGIRKLTAISQVLFRISLTDVHHAFHRMKTRAGSRTLFLDQLKQALEEYMDKDV